MSEQVDFIQDAWKKWKGPGRYVVLESTAAGFHTYSVRMDSEEPVRPSDFITPVVMVDVKHQEQLAEILECCYDLRKGTLTPQEAQELLS